MRKNLPAIMQMGTPMGGGAAYATADLSHQRNTASGCGKVWSAGIRDGSNSQEDFRYRLWRDGDASCAH